MAMRILVVEDEHKIANSIKKGLEQENFAVDVAYDGETGNDLALSEGYDVIILDLMLPGMNGIEVCKSMRAENNHTPILVLTAKGETEDKVMGLNAGADDYLAKPFAFSELVARIKALSRRPTNSLSPILQIENLVLDTHNFTVFRDKKEINLTKTEFLLLEQLMRNMGKVLSKEKLINHVWNYEADVLPNTVEVYIGYLRKKIDKPFNKKLIKTIHGFGYKIEA